MPLEVLEAPHQLDIVAGELADLRRNVAELGELRQRVIALENEPPALPPPEPPCFPTTLVTDVTFNASLAPPLLVERDTFCLR